LRRNALQITFTLFAALAWGSGCASQGGGAASNSVGSPCESSSDCASGLACRSDTIDFVADLQCTASCSSDSTCIGTYGAGTFCIGAMICVQACRDNADCPAKTVCNDNKWCERTGPGSGVPYCAGTPTPCEALSDCTVSIGCTSASACTGSVSSCSSLTSASCAQQARCSWNYTTNQCSGPPDVCGSLTNATSCSSQSGCVWNFGTGCIGTPAPCSGLPGSICKHTAGCIVALG
jgi:hypothetical protein